MARTRRRVGAPAKLAGICLLMLVPGNPDAGAAQDVSRTLVLRVFNDARTPVSDLEAAETEATRLYTAAGIRLVWINPHARTQPLDTSGLTQDGPKNRHVRSVQPDVVALLDDGIERSATLAAMVAALDASDVIVYIETTIHTPNRVMNQFDGYLAHRLTIVGDRRYLWIVVNAGLERDRLLSTIAHELQHAVEVAHAAAVRSDEAIHTFFHGIDSRTCGRDCTETEAAVRVQKIVLRELRTNRTVRSRRQPSRTK